MKYLINIIALILIALLIFGAIKFKDSNTYYAWSNRVSAFFDQGFSFISARKQNISLELSPSRKSPLTFIEQEEILKIYVPNVFGNFSPRQWIDFWNLIYKPVRTSQGFFAKKRYLTKDEIERHLSNSYPNPFSYFSQNHWHDFWEIAKVNWSNE